MGAIVAVLIQQMPEIIQLGKLAFAKQHPELPVPTSEEIIAGWLQAAASSLTKDALWLAAHGETPTDH